MNASNPEKPLARDRIAQVYLGDWGSEVFQTQTRNRIHWFVDQIENGTVLDIGCSEGILPILLGRKGIDVIGMDINPETIEFAKNLLAKEEPAVASHVTFVCDDFIRRGRRESKFDVVTLGEIIEHFDQPEILIQKAVSRLKPGGRLLVTTPFGILPDPDHRITFTLTTFLDYFKNNPLTPLSLTIVDSYIRFIAKNTPAQPDQWQVMASSVIKLTEQGLLDEQRKFRAHIDDLISQNKDLVNTVSDLRKRVEIIHKLKTEKKAELEAKQALDTRYKSLEIAQKELMNNIMLLKSQYQQLLNDHTVLKKQLQQMESENNTIKRELQQMESANATIKRQLQQMINDNVSLRKQVQDLNTSNTKLVANYTAFTKTFTYQISHEVVTAFKPLRLTSLLLPVNFVKVTWRWIKRKIQERHGHK